MLRATTATGQLKQMWSEGGEGGARTFGGRDDVVAEEVGEDLAELDLEVRGARGGAGGGGGGGGDELAELVDVGEVAGHGRQSPPPPERKKKYRREREGEGRMKKNRWTTHHRRIILQPGGDT